MSEKEVSGLETVRYSKLRDMQERHGELNGAIETLREILCETDAIISGQIPDVLRVYWDNTYKKIGEYDRSLSYSEKPQYDSRRRNLYNVMNKLTEEYLQLGKEIKIQAVKDRIKGSNSKRP